MKTRAENKSSRRKWVDRGALLVIILICLLLLIRCGNQPKTVSGGEEGSVPSQAGSPPEMPERGESDRDLLDEKRVAPGKGSEVETVEDRTAQALPGGLPAVSSVPTPTAQIAETAALPQPKEEAVLPVDTEAASGDDGQHAAVLNEEQELLCPGPPTGSLAETKARPGTFIDPVTRMSFVLVKGGCFRMGSNDGARDQRPVHEVCVNDFYLGEYEVTQAQYEWIMRYNPSSFQRCNLPVESVSWEDAQAYIRKLNEASGASYRLPSEAEWEYAATTGWRAEKASSVDPTHVYAAYMTHLGTPTSEARRRPNGWGVYDMEFNVWEWVSDWYGANYYASSPRTNPQGPPSGSHRVIRAASRYEPPRFHQRYGALPTENHDYFGFRIAFSATSLANDLPEAQKADVPKPSDRPHQDDLSAVKSDPASGPAPNPPVL